MATDDEKPGTPWVTMILIALTTAAIGAALVIPQLIEARKQGGEFHPIGALKTIGTSQALFREGDKDGNRVLDYGTLAQLSATGLIDPVLGSGTKRGYVYRTAPSATTPEFIWFAVASPVTRGVDGDRYFCTNQAGTIYYTVTGPFALDTGAGEIPKTALPVGR